eukprot:gene12550-biopygen2094
MNRLKKACAISRTHFLKESKRQTAVLLCAGSNGSQTANGLLTDNLMVGWRPKGLGYKADDVEWLKVKAKHTVTIGVNPERRQPKAMCVIA